MCSIPHFIYIYIHVHIQRRLAAAAFLMPQLRAASSAYCQLLLHGIVLPLHWAGFRVRLSCFICVACLALLPLPLPLLLPLQLRAVLVLRRLAAWAPCSCGWCSETASYVRNKAHLVAWLQTVWKHHARFHLAECRQLPEPAQLNIQLVADALTQLNWTQSWTRLSLPRCCHISLQNVNESLSQHCKDIIEIIYALISEASIHISLSADRNRQSDSRLLINCQLLERFCGKHFNIFKYFERNLLQYFIFNCLVARQLAKLSAGFVLGQ